MAVASSPARLGSEPIRADCPDCGELILAVVVPASPRHQRPEAIVIASPWEWEPRTRCYVCANNAARAGDRCPGCNGTGYVGEKRFLTRTSTSRGGEAKTCSTCEGLGTIGAPKRLDCTRCGGEGYVGRERPDEQMLAIDVAWSDTGHIRLLGPSTARKKGEALYELHTCADGDQRAILPLPEPRRKVAA